MAEETLQKVDEARIKEIHHRIENNLQLISFLLSLEAERFSDIKCPEARLSCRNERRNRYSSQ